MWLNEPVERIEICRNPLIIFIDYFFYYAWYYLNKKAFLINTIKFYMCKRYLGLIPNLKKINRNMLLVFKRRKYKPMLKSSFYSSGIIINGAINV